LGKVLALCLLTTLTVLSLLSTTSFVVSVHAQEQYSISTDKPVYNVGENVTIYVNPAPSQFPNSSNGLSVYLWVWIVVTKPDQSQVSPALGMALAPDCNCSATATLVADIAGQYRLDLWSEWLTVNGSLAPNTTPQLKATCYFQAGENQTLKFIPIATAIVVIAAVVLLVLRRRKRKKT
jgi:hypothetical protein